MTDIPWIKVLVVFAVALGLVLMKRRRRQKSSGARKIAEHRLAAQYLEQDPEDIEDATPYIKRARWAMVLTSAIVVMFIALVFLSS